MKKTWRFWADYFIKQHVLLKAAVLNIPLGAMLVVADQNFLYLLKFVDQHQVNKELEFIRCIIKARVVPGKNFVIKSIENELKLYFAGALQSFKTPVCLLGSSFQKVVWKQLLLIPYGKTISYLQQAALIGKKTAYRAVALANAANQINIMIPCHRVIKNSGDLGGYNGGVDRKKWLINHE